jgi:hypothetical protein
LLKTWWREGWVGLHRGHCQHRVYWCHRLISESWGESSTRTAQPQRNTSSSACLIGGPAIENHPRSTRFRHSWSASCGSETGAVRQGCSYRFSDAYDVEEAAHRQLVAPDALAQIHVFVAHNLQKRHLTQTTH